jgi:hypothetical protein
MNFQVVGYNEESLAKVRDDYPGAFKQPPAGVPHPTGLGTMPGTGSQTADLANVAGKGLVIKVAATHAGLVTRNNGFYLPDKMRGGVGTWTEHYQKPIQVHHEDHKDPVGRVIAARYVETVGAVTDRFKNHVLRDSYGKQVGTANEKFWRDFCDDGSFINKLQQIKMMDSILNDPHYSGVGFIELTADITDPVAIQKVLDGRFLTGSVGAVSDKAVCSVCNTNWLEEEHCGHKPGRLYDGKKCFVVAGNLEYDEWSFVNTPADRHALVLEAGQNGISDSRVEDSASRVLYFVPTDLSNEEGARMKDTATEVKPDEADIQDAAGEQEVIEDSADNAATDVTENTQEAGSEDTSAESTSIEDSTEETGEIQDGAQQSFELFELAMNKLFVDGADFTDADEEALYEAMMSTLTEEDGISVEDAKLSTAARKKLPSSAFCGPERSFPVNDCAHYTAAKRLLSRYKGPGDKSTISDCIERKGKALGCPAAKKKDSAEKTEALEDAVTQDLEDRRLTADLVHQLVSALDTGLYGRPFDESEEEAPVLDEDQAKMLRTMIAELAKRIGKDNVSAAVVEEGLAVSKDEHNIQVEETLRNEDTLGDLRDQLSALRRELSATYDDVAQLEDRLIEKASEAREAKVARLKDLHVLDDSLNEEVEASLATISDEALDNSLTTLLAKVDTVKIADKLNDGLSRIPDETVDNPAAVTEPSSAAELQDNVDQNMEAKPSFATQRMVDETYHYLFVKQQNPIKAKQYYTDMVTAGMAAADPKKMLAHDNKEE